MSKTVSVRVGHRSVSRTKVQRRHDMRQGRIPAYVDSEKTVSNSVIVAPPLESDLRKLCLERRALNPKIRAMKHDAAIATVGVITFGKEAQPIVNRLDYATQDELFTETAKRIADFLKTEISGLNVHRDESALHAHFQMPAFNLEGKALSKIITPTISKRLQDIAGEVFGVHGIHRGKPKAQRILDNDPLHTIVHRSVQQLHNDLPLELAAAESKISEAKQKIQNYERLVSENMQKLEAGLGDEVKIQKRIAVYEGRIETMRGTEREIEAEKLRLSDMRHEIEAAEMKLSEKQRELETNEKTLAETRANLNAGIKTFTEKATIFKQVQKKFEADKSQWHTSGAKLGAIFSSARKALSGPDKEIEKLQQEKAEAEKRVSKAVKAEELRWSPALKEAWDEARYQAIKREEAEAARRAAEEQLAALRHQLRPGGYDSGLSSPKRHG